MRTSGGKALAESDWQAFILTEQPSAEEPTATIENNSAEKPAATTEWYHSWYDWRVVTMASFMQARQSVQKVQAVDIIQNMDVPSESETKKLYRALLQVPSLPRTWTCGDGGTWTGGQLDMVAPNVEAKVEYCSGIGAPANGHTHARYATSSELADSGLVPSAGSAYNAASAAGCAPYGCATFSQPSNIARITNMPPTTISSLLLRFNNIGHDVERFL